MELITSIFTKVILLTAFLFWVPSKETKTRVFYCTGAYYTWISLENISVEMWEELKKKIYCPKNSLNFLLLWKKIKKLEPIIQLGSLGDKKACSNSNKVLSKAEIPYSYHMSIHTMWPSPNFQNFLFTFWRRLWRSTIITADVTHWFLGFRKFEV